MTADELFKLILAKFPSANTKVIPFEVFTEIIQSRERKAFEWANNNLIAKQVSPVEMKCETKEFEDYLVSKEYNE